MKIMSTTTDQDLVTLKADFKDLKKDISDLSNAIKDLAVDETMLGYAKLKATTDKSVKQVEQEIEEHPFASVGVAIGVGFLIGVVLDRLTR